MKSACSFGPELAEIKEIHRHNLLLLHDLLLDLCKLHLLDCYNGYRKIIWGIE